MNDQGNPRLRLSIRNIYATWVMNVDSATFLFDPVGVNPNDYADVDAVVVTHEHLDHFDKGIVDNLHDGGRRRILTTPYVAGMLENRENIVLLTPGECYDAGGLRVYAERCEHAAKDPVTVVIETGWFSMYYPVDSDYFPEMAAIRDRYRPDILIYLRPDRKTLQTISDAIQPRMIFCCEYPMMEPVAIPGVQVVQAKPLGWSVYPKTL